MDMRASGFAMDLQGVQAQIHCIGIRNFDHVQMHSLAAVLLLLLLLLLSLSAPCEVGPGARFEQSWVYLEASWDAVDGP